MFLWSAAAATMVLFPGLADAQYKFTTFDVPGATSTAVNTNSTHAIAGEFDDDHGNRHGFVLDNHGFIQFDIPGALATTINGMNASGDLAGLWDDGTRLHGFVIKNGKTTTIDPPGSTYTGSINLNASGLVLGAFRNTSPVPQTRHGVLLDKKGAFTTFDAPGAVTPGGTVPASVNDHGEIVGNFVNGAGRHGFILSKGVWTQLDVPGSVLTVAQGISDSGVIVGAYVDDTNFDEHGWVLIDGVYFTVDVPGSTFTAIFNINSHGEIVGAYGDADGVQHGFIGTPKH
jgi:uncharacterized membrane protein